MDHARRRRLKRRDFKAFTQLRGGFSPSQTHILQGKHCPGTVALTILRPKEGWEEAMSRLAFTVLAALVLFVGLPGSGWAFVV
jgi:hypothetical protein